MLKAKLDLADTKPGIAMRTEAVARSTFLGQVEFHRFRFR